MYVYTGICTYVDYQKLGYSTYIHLYYTVYIHIGLVVKAGKFSNQPNEGGNKDSIEGGGGGGEWYSTYYVYYLPTTTTHYTTHCMY